jgi:Helix-turn-helix domain
MVLERLTHSPERLEIVRWTARMGAVTAPALAARLTASLASASARLVAAERAGLLRRDRPLAGQPALFTVTRAGLHAVGLRQLEPCRVSASGARHLIACASVAVTLERCYPTLEVLGERELRAAERELGAPLASARIGMGYYGGWLLHRPDLVLRSRECDAERPVAVEVELTVKAPRRLSEICRAWARSRSVAGVLYVAAPAVQRALARAIECSEAHEQITVVSLQAALAGSIERTIPSAD